MTILVHAFEIFINVLREVTVVGAKAYVALFVRVGLLGILEYEFVVVDNIVHSLCPIDLLW
jgi:hypothetical protein